jgi:cytochrome c peroxidase
MTGPFIRAFTAACAAAFLAAVPARADGFSAAEIQVLRSLTLAALPPLPPDPTNRYADDPRAAEFGHLLFFDKRLSSNGKVGCVTCHQPERDFTDGRPLARGVGRTDRNAPTIVGAAYNAWFFWDGRKDSQWSQALASMENPVEQNLSRAKALDILRRDRDYARRYREIFGELPRADDPDGPTRAFVAIGKSIAAYERAIRPGVSRFDRYVEAIAQGREPPADGRLSLDEELGVRALLRVRQSQCLRCHNGPLFTNGAFHNIGSQNREDADNEQGRIQGVEKAVADEFNCLSRWSDAPKEACAELVFARRGEKQLVGAFKVPTLRNVSKTGPYMHNGRIPTLEDVIWHYRTSSGGPVGQSELEAATLTGAEFDQLQAFLKTLEARPDAPAKYLKPPARFRRPGT